MTTEQQAHKTSLEHLDEMRAAALEGGGEERVKAQHAKGKLTARERIEFLVDESSFVEVGGYVTHRCTDFDMSSQKILGDGSPRGRAGGSEKASLWKSPTVRG